MFGSFQHLLFEGILKGFEPGHHAVKLHSHNSQLVGAADRGALCQITLLNLIEGFDEILKGQMKLETQILPLKKQKPENTYGY